MLRSLVIPIFLLIPSSIIAQNCDSFVFVTNDQSGEMTVNARKNVNVTSKDGKAFDIATLTTLNTAVIVIGVSGSNKCVAANDLVEITFTDQSTIRLGNSFENCTSRSVLYLSPAHRNMDLLAQLSNKQIATLKVWTKTEFVVLPFDKAQRIQFSNTLKCLALYVPVPANYKGDSLQHFDEPEYSVDSTKVDAEVSKPKFPGGDEAAIQFMMKNIKGIPEAIGTVYVSFTVTEKGEIEEPSIMRGLNPKVDAEVLRVIKLMPPWTPGMKNGVPMKARMIMPFKFRYR